MSIIVFLIRPTTNEADWTCWFHISAFARESLEALDEAVFRAVRNGEEKALSELIQKGARIDIADSKGSGPLEIAVTQSDAEMVKFLLSLPDLKPNQVSGLLGHNLVATAFPNARNLEILELLIADPRISLDPSPGSEGVQGLPPLLLQAASLGEIEFFKLFLKDSRFDLNEKGPSGLGVIEFAGLGRNLEILELSLNHPDLNPLNTLKGRRPALIHAAIMSGAVSILEKYWNDERFETGVHLHPKLLLDPIQLIALRGHVDSIRFFLGTEDFDLLIHDQDRWDQFIELALKGKNADFFSSHFRKRYPLFNETGAC